MEKIMISIKHKYAQKILSGEKVWELRTKLPKCEVPFKVFIYDSAKKGVVAEFICDKILKMASYTVMLEGTGLTKEEIYHYAGDRKYTYYWHISKLVEYFFPRELDEFYMKCKIYEKGDGCWDTKCPYYEVPSYEYGEINYDCEGMRPITVPPQLWYYVEEK